ncbi:MAG TPA: histidine kinase [Steroidobacteraceae bacterium]|jgi:Histidine kinase|nr:histidine kinase [Steroidobacteraceae bacterium]
MASILTAFQSYAAPVVEDKEKFLSRRGVLILATLFWTYCTLTDFVYHEGMRIELSEVSSTVMLVLPWQQRLLQHVLLLPLLLACYSAAVRIGWKPARWRVPQQLLLALGFSLLMFWVMRFSGVILYELFGTPADLSGNLTRGDWAVWVSNTATTFFDYWFGLALITGLQTYRRYHGLQLRNSELRRDWAGARLAALRSQLSPHTLFNVLNTIQARISGEPEIAQTLIASLGDLLRGLLQAGERDFTLLRDELKFVELYLGLQVGRFADRLAVSVQNGADAPAVWVPSLILQPLVENAVVHGLADHSGPVRIEVSWELSPGRLQLKVVNSAGAGNAPSSTGLGLRNVRERLMVQFGRGAVLAAGPGDHSTWVATLSLPVLREWRAEPMTAPALGRQ